jgi:hypothetical protein
MLSFKNGTFQIFIARKCNTSEQRSIFIRIDICQLMYDITFEWLNYQPFSS